MNGRTLVMGGSLSDFRLDEILQIVGLSRQFTAIVLKEKNITHGVIFVKSGMVVNAQTKEKEQGRNAFFSLFRQPGEVFEVFRVPAPSSYPVPLGGVNAILVEAAKSSTSQQSSEVEDLSLTMFEAVPPLDNSEGEEFSVPMNAPINASLEAMTEEIRAIRESQSNEYDEQKVLQSISSLGQNLKAIESKLNTLSSSVGDESPVILELYKLSVRESGTPKSLPYLLMLIILLQVVLVAMLTGFFIFKS